ncbi:unnamed protein product [Anisakis simplex]|uniref:Uncharacterized protein n=1 Tax=Anisakis simplex TaxID=6269 RepID=A0A3P6SAZ1_ANISI|nr:unnamed protein product [Anisakis simplex]
MFVVPNDFKLEIEEKLSKKFKEKFCEPIKSREYEEQREKGIESHLMALLDEIVANENLSVAERKKQLKKRKPYNFVKIVSEKMDPCGEIFEEIVNKLKNFQEDLPAYLRATFSNAKVEATKAANPEYFG